MAEVYGKKPEKFTAAWWEYFWMYYKWHTIIGAFAIIVTISTIYGMVTAEKYDMTVFHVGNVVISAEESEKIEAQLSPYCEDLDKNGEKNLLFTSDIATDAQRDPEYYSAIITKLYASLSDGSTYVYILSRELADNLSGEDEDDCAFTPLDEWFSGEIDEEDIYSVHGKSRGIEASQIKVFKESGVNLDGHYILLRKAPEKGSEEYNHAVRFLEKIS